MKYSLRSLMSGAMLWPPLLAGLFPLWAMYLLLVIFGIILIASLGTYWANRRAYNTRLDDETVERMKNLKDSP